MVWDLIQHYWRNGIEICILWILIYQMYRLFRATRGARIMVGLIVVLVIFIALVQVFRFQVISWISHWALIAFFIALPVIFQPEIRTALARVGGSHWLNWLVRNDRRQAAFLENLTSAVAVLSNKHVGALFAFERNISLKSIQETGTLVSALFSPELAHALFFPKSPLHDGAVIIVDERIQAAACVLPVSQRELRDRSLGLRHRAALGLTEETDAVCVVVSEETGAISICMNGQIEHDLELAEFDRRLKEIFLQQDSQHEKGISQKLGPEDHLADSGDSHLDVDSVDPDR